MDVYDEVKHAAIHKKVDGQMIPFERAVIEDARPTSGKHYAREHKYAERKGALQPPNHDPVMSNVSRNFEKSKRVEGLLNRLANYMAGEIPDNDDLDDLFQKDKEAIPEEPTEQQFDDATTNFTKDDFNIPTGPMVIEANEEDVEIEQSEDTLRQPEEDNLQEIEEEDDNHTVENEIQEVALPDIYTTLQPKDRFKRKQEKKKKPEREENLFIYKDFDTSLTQVKGNIKQLPVLKETTTIQGRDLLRDRLLSYNVRGGSLQKLPLSEQKKTLNMKERSILLQKRKQAQSQLQLSKMQPANSNNAVHKAFWVQSHES